MFGELTSTELREKFKSIWPDQHSDAEWYRNGEEPALRIHRAISWVERAEQETDDRDAKFIFYWIAFNAAYAQHIKGMGDKNCFKDFIDRIVDLDSNGRIYQSIWNIHLESIRSLLNNLFVFQPFWHFYNLVDGYDDYEHRFRDENREAREALRRDIKDAKTVLSRLFERLYTIRNQLIHGGSTWNSSISQNQVRLGAGIMKDIVPIFIYLMIDSREENWGPPHYPRIDVL